MKLILICIITFSLSLGSMAEAQTKTISHDEGYEYEFEDDPLNAGGFGADDARIRIRRGAQRTTLIKPRTSFIRELIKSVEDI